MIIAFTDSEIDWLIAVCPAEEYGQDWRVQLLAHRIRMRKALPPTHVAIMDITLEKLWQIDDAIMLNGPYTAYLFDPTQPLLYLSDKIWRAIATEMGYLEEDESGNDTYETAQARQRAEEG